MAIPRIEKYAADIEWLRLSHPAEYAKLPDRLLRDPAVLRMHGALETAAGWRWTMFFVSEADDEKLDGREVILDIPRPDPEPDDGNFCRYHTLLVSRPYCKYCTYQESVTATESAVSEQAAPEVLAVLAVPAVVAIAERVESDLLNPEA